ncbi:MAG: aminotransferase class V-fold PLP-dependent enzyme [Planctomycetota bacterium]|nr:aminotransferase class V-fold PLP-dependent enzyme [Planctomycetota bacterium]MDA0933370.1 aminotransferase class V-fold PLP-dependent enzyme [Planctomycetota bacterium]MDA1223419.1 aminotransferase class V-fold PLP-dependent enzyme [Planctomycetota bacterium]
MNAPGIQDVPHPILFIPGPVEVDAELRAILATPAIGHRQREAKDAFILACGGLRELYRTEQHAFFENAPATALMEAGIRNLVHKRSLHMTCGAFSERWAKIATACGREPVVVARAWGEAILPEHVAEALEAADEPYEAICLTHSETSTGVLNPIGEIAATVREHSPDTLILVDAVTSVAGAELAFDEWGLDLAFAGTQKCLALPPGLVTYALSERAVQRSHEVPGRGFLLDFAATPARFATGESPATPCVPLVFALNRQLERIRTEGLEARWSRHTAMRDLTLRFGAENGFPPFVEHEHRSPTVTALRAADSSAVDGVIERARAAGFSLGRGYGKLKQDTFRIGHMGDHPIERVEALLDAIRPA